MKEEIYKMIYKEVEKDKERIDKEKKLEKILKKLNKETKVKKEYFQILGQYFIQNNSNKGKIIIRNKKYNMNGINPLASPREGVNVFTSPYLSEGAPSLGEAKGLMNLLKLIKIKMLI